MVPMSSKSSWVCPVCQSPCFSSCCQMDWDFVTCEFWLGTPFSKTTATSLDPTARNLKIRDHASNLLYQTPFKSDTWHNIAVQVDWDSRTLAVLYSADDSPLQPVTDV